MAKRQYQGIPLTGMSASHATVLVDSMLKKVEEEGLPFLRLAKRKVPLPGIQNALNVMEKQGTYLSGI
jgi:hypothetical protein